MVTMCCSLLVQARDIEPTLVAEILNEEELHGKSLNCLQEM